MLCVYELLATTTALVPASLLSVCLQGFDAALEAAASGFLPRLASRVANRIAVGALTHSSRQLDFGLDLT